MMLPLAVQPCVQGNAAPGRHRAGVPPSADVRRPEEEPIKRALPPALAEPPDLSGLAQAALETVELTARVAAERDRWVNREGGDVASSGSRRSLLRHVANYLAAADLAARRGGVRRVVDVGGGTGALGVWLARRLGAHLVLVDADPGIRAVAERAFPEIDVCADLTDVEPCSGDLVTAMEVIEHIQPHAQRAFTAHLGELLAPTGTLILSTPDETRYVGGWSGYAPHVGILDADELAHLVTQATGLPAAVWRLEGWPFELGRWRRFALPVLNRAWAAVDGAVPASAARAGAVFTSALSRIRPPRPPADPDTAFPGTAQAVAPAHGDGTGLIAVAARRS